MSKKKLFKNTKLGSLLTRTLHRWNSWFSIYVTVTTVTITSWRSVRSPHVQVGMFFLYLINFANCTVWDLKPRALRWDFNILHMICSLRADSSNGSTSLSLRNTSKGMGWVAVRQLDVEMRIEFYIVISQI